MADFQFDFQLKLKGRDLGESRDRPIRIDGSRRTLQANGEGITLSTTNAPMLLLYDGGENSLPQRIGAPLATLEVPTPPISLRGSTKLTVTSLDAKGEVIWLRHLSGRSKRFITSEPTRKPSNFS